MEPVLPLPSGTGDAAGQQAARIARVRALVGSLCGHADVADPAIPGIALAYDRAAPVVQRRYDAVADEIAGWASVGVRALLAAGDAPAAAAGLFAELTRAERRLARTLGR